MVAQAELAPVIDMFTRTERVTPAVRVDIQKRLASIAVEQMLLAGEKSRLEMRLHGNL